MKGDDSVRRCLLLLTLLLLTAGCAAGEEVCVTLPESGGVTLTEGGTYRLTGTGTGCVTVECGEDEVELILEDVTLVNPEGPCILLNSGDAILRLPAGTVSSLTSGTACDVLTAQLP